MRYKFYLAVYNRGMIRIIAGGKKSRNWVLGGQEEYLKRLKMPFDAQIEYWDEAKIADLGHKWPFKTSEYVVLLDERGENISSPELSERLSSAFTSGKSVVLIIGGAYGVAQEVRDKADFIWSISKLVFPHELMRILLSEQIYRAQEIYKGSKYHHE